MNPQTKKILRRIVDVVMWILLARVIISWIAPLRDSIVGEIIYKITNPVVAPIQGLLPEMGFDLSVLIIYFALSFLRNRFLR